MMPTLPDPHVLSVDVLCRAAATVLTEKLPTLVELLGVQDRYPKPISTWQQLPTAEALTTATFPAGAITSTGLVGTPRRDGRGSTDATWRLAIGVYDRGEDHDDTQGRVRDWCSFVRTVLLMNPSLGGVADGLTWVNETYSALRQKSAARTLAGGAVLVDVHATNVLDLGAATGPLVLSTYPTLTAHAPDASPA